MCATCAVVVSGATGSTAPPAHDAMAALSRDALGGLPPARLRRLLAGPARRRARVVVRWRVPAHAGYARLTRHWFRACLALLGESGEAADDAELVFAELVGNAARHTDAWLQVTIVAIPAGLRIEVADSCRQKPRLASRDGAEPDGESGRGLALVDALAPRWGVRGHVRAGKTVWFEHHLAMPG